MSDLLKPGERVDDLIHGGMKIIQHPELPRFAIDAVLLASFATIKKGDRVIDLGAGTGVIPLLLAERGIRKQQAIQKITGLEIRPEMAEMAHRSIVLNDLQDIIEIRQGNINQATSLFSREKFDLVTVNPPYQQDNSGGKSPSDLRAIARHEVYCSLSEVISAASALLRYGGRLAMIHRPGRLTEICTCCSKTGLEPKRMRLVHPYATKKANMVLIEARKGGRADLEVLPPLFVYSEKGKYSKELLTIYFGEKQV